MSQFGSASKLMGICNGIDMFEEFMLAQAVNNVRLEDDMECDHRRYTQIPSYQSRFTRRLLSEDFQLSLSASLSTFDAITIRELFLKNHHPGRVLYGLFCMERPLTSDLADDIETVLSDANGSTIRVITNKRLWDTTSSQGIELHFALGMQVAIKEPLIERCEDEAFAVRVINPAQLIYLHNVDADCYSPAESSDVTTVAELQKNRREGNRFFAEENWAAAVRKYSLCINQAVRNVDNTTSQENLNGFLMLAYSNRAEAWLRLKHYKDAMSDAEKALDIQPKHVKTLVRKGKAAQGLGLFSKACEAFEAAMEESPGERSVLKSLNACRIAFKQSIGKHDDLVADFVLKGLGECPPCAEFVGPVEVRRVGYGHGRRGLFATISVKAGELLLVSNPLVIIPYSKGFGGLAMDSITVWEDLIVGLVKQITTSKRQMAQLWSLTSYDHREVEMAIPSMELFKPGSEWVPPASEKLEVDLGRIRGIAKLNAFKRVETVEGLYSGIWVLPSFINHSCVPNTMQTFHRGSMFLRASVDIMEGEEITMWYFDSMFQDVDTRKAKAKNFDFTCKCERCLLEELLEAQLWKMRKAIPKLVMGAEAERHTLGGRTGWASAELSKVADDVEAVIQSSYPKLGSKQQGWIRATFLDAYLAKLHPEIYDGASPIEALSLVLDVTTSIGVNNYVLLVASMLLSAVKQEYSKRSKRYQLTLDRVLALYAVAYGRVGKSILLEMVRARLKAPLRGLF